MPPIEIIVRITALPVLVELLYITFKFGRHFEQMRIIHEQERKEEYPNG